MREVDLIISKGIMLIILVSILSNSHSVKANTSQIYFTEISSISAEPGSEIVDVKVVGNILFVVDA
ncbi:MAG: hypothetical protein ACFE95_02510 [Candidatus Hodarchaeota archaeon]